MIVVNIFGGPGIGKSTTAFKVCSILKERQINCELVTEQAKNFTWEDRHTTLECQPYIFGKQLRDLWRLRNKVDIAVTDAPLLLSLIYFKSEDWPDSFFPYVVDQFNTFDNMNFLLDRNKPYSEVGRNQTEDQAKQIDLQIKVLLDYLKLKFVELHKPDAWKRNNAEIIADMAISALKIREKKRKMVADFKS